MRILVTGTDGYIGALLAPLLRDRGHDVYGLDTGFYRDGCLYAASGAGVTTTRKDVRHATLDDVRGFEAVVHLAELSNDPLGQLNPALTRRINYEASVRFARLCREAGVSRFVYSSSCSVYGVAADGAVSEDTTARPQTVYAECKLLVERAVGSLADDGFTPTFLRNATAYGPSPRMRFDLVVNNLAGLAWTTGEIRMTSDGTPWRPLVHVLDICEAIATVLEAPREVVHNQVLNVGDDRENYQVRDIAEAIARTFPGCALAFGQQGADTRSYRVSFAKLRHVLPHFTCRRDVAAGARELRDLFESVGMTPELFEGRPYTRLKQLEHLLATGRLDPDLYWV
jgi:nucleoside-diphosphate-sugar epimerase